MTNKAHWAESNRHFIWAARNFARKTNTAVPLECGKQGTVSYDRRRSVERLNPTSFANGTQNSRYFRKFHQRGCTQNVFLNSRKLYPEFLPFHSISDRKSRNFWSNGKRPPTPNRTGSLLLSNMRTKSPSCNHNVLSIYQIHLYTFLFEVHFAYQRRTSVTILGMLLKV